MYQKIVKPCLDFLFSLLAIIGLSPIFLTLIIAIKLDSKGDIFFRQKRIGKDKKFFTIYKFRTMKSNTPKDIPTHLLNNPDDYITKVGRFLRKTSLDELPQLFNILAGQMSVIGPRPALFNQDDLVEERDKYFANSVRPGLTGLAQISGRDELEIPVKAKLDGEYVDSMSFIGDCKLFFKTIGKVLKSEGVKEGQKNEVTEENIEEATEAIEELKLVETATEVVAEESIEEGMEATEATEEVISNEVAELTTAEEVTPGEEAEESVPKEVTTEELITAADKPE